MNPTTIAGRQLAADLPDLAEWVTRVEVEARADVDGLVARLLELLGPSHPHDEGKACGTCAAYNLLLAGDKAEAPLACICCEEGFYCRHRCQNHPKPNGISDSGKPWAGDKAEAPE